MDGKHSFSRQSLVSFLKLDLHSLAFFRIVFSLAVLHDLGLRMADLANHYADTGAFPRWLAMEYLEPQRWSFHLASGSMPLMAVLFILHMGIMLLLMIGYRTRLMTILSWIFLFSLHSRNSAVLGGGDILLRVMNFWAIFLPLGAVWSWDAWSGQERGEGQQAERKKKPPVTVSLTASLCYTLQLCLVYWFTAILKVSPEWREDYSAIYYALQIDQVTTPIGRWLTQFPEWLKICTRMTLIGEYFGPLLLFIPGKKGLCRMLAVCGFWFFHCVALGITMNVGVFPYACFAAWSALLPGAFWQRPRIQKIIARISEIFLHTFAFFQRQDLTLPQAAWAHFFSWFKKGSLIFIFAYIVFWNGKDMDQIHKQTPGGLWSQIFESKLVKNWGENWRTLGYVLGIDQSWALFAPRPYKDDGWFVIKGQLRNGDVIDAFSDEKIKSEADLIKRPENIYRTFHTRRWAKFLRNVWFKDYQKMRAPLANSLCEHWNHHRKDEMEKMEYLEIFYMKEESVPYPRKPAAEVIPIWQQYCPLT